MQAVLLAKCKGFQYVKTWGNIVNLVQDIFLRNTVIMSRDFVFCWQYLLHCRMWKYPP